METKCCICGRELKNQESVDYLCEHCDEKYGFYDDYETPILMPIRKRKRYDDER